MKKYVLFNLFKTSLAIEISDLKEVVHIDRPTLLPHLPEEIAWVQNIRGRLGTLVWYLPFLDIHSENFHKVSADHVPKMTEAILIEWDESLFGFVVSEILEFIQDTGSNPSPERVRGHLVIDPAKILQEMMHHLQINVAKGKM